MSVLFYSPHSKLLIVVTAWPEIFFEIIGDEYDSKHVEKSCFRGRDSLDKPAWSDIWGRGVVKI